MKQETENRLKQETEKWKRGWIEAVCLPVTSEELIILCILFDIICSLVGLCKQIEKRVTAPSRLQVAYPVLVLVFCHHILAFILWFYFSSVILFFFLYKVKWYSRSIVERSFFPFLIYPNFWTMHNTFLYLNYVHTRMHACMHVYVCCVCIVETHQSNCQSNSIYLLKSFSLFYNVHGFQHLYFGRHAKNTFDKL